MVADLRLFVKHSVCPQQPSRFSKT